MKTRSVVSIFHINDIVLLLGLLISLNAWAEPEAIGSLIEAQGQVKINGKPVKVGAELRLGMRIVTGVTARAVLKFIDGQIVALKADSVFWIKDYRYIKNNEVDRNRYNNDNPKRESRSFLELLKGGMRFISGAMSKETPEAIKIVTPVATIGVRGTEFTALVGSLCLLVHEGKVSVTSEGKTLVAGEGKIVFVRSKGSPPEYVPASKLRSVCDAPELAAAPPTSETAICACRSLVAALASGSISPSSTSAATATATSAIGTTTTTSVLATTTAITAAIATGAILINESNNEEDPAASSATPP